MAVRVTHTGDLSREVWLRFRSKGIGGSDIGAIMGYNNWKGPVDVYFEKVNPPEAEEEISQAAYFGSRLEDFVAEEFTLQTGLKVRRNNFLLQHEDYPFLLANVDRVIVNKEEGPGILECKTASEWLKDSWNDEEVPPSYFFQVQHYLAVTGYKYGYIAALIGGNKFFIKRIDRDDELIQDMIHVASKFWHEHVVPKVQPEWDGKKSSTELLNELYPEAQQEKMVLPNNSIELIDQYEKAKENEKFWKSEKDKFANQLKGMLGEFSTGEAGDKRIFWKNQSRSSIDAKRLKEEQPELYEQYLKTTAYRKFDVK